MKKLLRFAGVTLLALTIGVFGCGDDDPVTPTVTVTVPPPTPTPPPLAVTMTPTSADVAVGSNVVFAINASGGAAGATASWTCASSDTTIATASVASSGCEATGVVPGGVTITAMVMKGSETGNAGSQLTVMGPQVGDPAFILIASIKDEFNETTGLKGRVDVQVNVERGDQVLEVLTLLVDGDSVDAQNFGVTTEPAMDEPAAQAIHAFTLSFDSDAHDAVTGDVGYENGDYEISMQLKVAGSELISSNVLTVDFNNDDGYVVTADLGENSAIGDDGRRWYGGPSNGTIDITALPVSYSGGSITSVTVNFCGKAVTDAEAPFTASFDCKGVESKTVAGEGAVVGEMPTISSAGTDGKILGDSPFPTFVDFVGPTESPIIVANPNGRANGWINADVSLSAERKKATDDALLTPGDKGTGGIGGYNMAVRVGKDVKAALAAAVASSVPAESASAGSYCAVAMATDALGNESPPADSTATCRGAPAGADALGDYDSDPMTPDVYGYDSNADNNEAMVTADDVDLSGQTLKFGVDRRDPVIKLDDDLMTRFIDTPDAVQFDANDDESNVGNSGLFGGDGVLVKVQRRTASKDDCAAVNAGDGLAGAVGTGADKDCGYVDIDGDQVTFGDSVSVAYYTVSGMAKDQAGNTSASVSHTFVYDNDVATATAPAVPGVIAAGKPFQGATYLNDNLSIRDYYGTVNFANPVGLNIGIGLPVALDDFNASSFTRLNHSVTTTVTTYAGLQRSMGDNFIQLSGVSVYVRDQAQIQYGDAKTTPIALANIESVPDDTLGHRTDAYTYEWVGRDEDEDDTYGVVCGLAACSDKTLKTSLKVEVRVIAPKDGTFRDPFERVDFLVADVNGASWVVGSDGSGTSGRQGGDENPRYRTWSYSVTLPGTMVNMATRGDTRGTGATGTAEPAMIRAIAVNKSGVGLLLSTGVTINRMKPAS